MERRSYEDALQIVMKNVGQVLVIDEAHKDKRASRRQREWGNIIASESVFDRL